MEYRPVSPDLSHRPESPDLSGLTASPRFGDFGQQAHHFPGAFGVQRQVYDPYQQPTSVPQQYPYERQYQEQSGMPPRQPKTEHDEDEYMPDANIPAKRARRVKQEPSTNGIPAPFDAIPTSSGTGDPTLSVTLNTSFPVARIKRIMQADEDIGKVAQVTPTVVSRALELFMIKLISASADQARGTGTGPSKGPKRVLAQHMKMAVKADDNFDFLGEIVDKVPDAPAKAKKEANSDSEEGAKPKRKGKKRKDSE